MNLKIAIIDSDQETLSELSDAFPEIKSVETVKVEQVLYLRPPAGLDAIFLVPPAAERWGSLSIAGRARVFRTTLEDQSSVCHAL